MFTDKNVDWFFSETKEMWTTKPSADAYMPPEVPFVDTHTKKEKQIKINSYIGDLFAYGPGAVRPVRDMESELALRRGLVYNGVLSDDVNFNLRANSIPLIEC